MENETVPDGTIHVPDGTIMYKDGPIWKVGADPRAEWHDTGVGRHKWMLEWDSLI